MSRPLHEVPCPTSSSSADVSTLTSALVLAMDGTGPAVAPVDASARSGEGRPTSPGTTTVPDDVALVVRTSGSTGEARGVMLGAVALRASAQATAARLGGPGRWLLALPAHHVAGLQVLVRSVLAGTMPVLLPPGPFRAPAFVEAAAVLHGPGTDGGPRYVSLVPTQLVRLLDDPAGTDALRGFDAVLVGGAAASGRLLERARDARVAVVTTYGMSETCGGCVYDGVPLDGVHVTVADDGRILLDGPVLATGYLGRPDLGATTFVQHGGVRTLRTSDAGRWDEGRLTVLGRLDDVLVTGGVKVAPAAVEDVVAGLPTVAEVCVVGVADPEWGQVVVAVVVPRPGTHGPALDEVRVVVGDRLGAAAAPRHVLTVDALPGRGPGKTDRRAVTDLAARTIRPAHR
ncbi:o-succinylbenzoate--CoA ligase [Cellulomonas soli]|uniref:o-succinylbenzoate--CoA ligase n=1 Tax=Cellulomonas soli TaxID=931535 RepID=UPI0017D5147F|nr:o-succinylbenzoate--CoA ligase [Cellulomonas soli]NYI58050.1 O-succinylbenzoic acid--CoA ligase [Cellulomonas soli]